MNILALIGARSGSKGMPGKNIRPLAGHPLLAYSILAALKTPSIQRVIVSTDSEEYAAIARTYGAEVPFLQPAETAQDDSGDYPFVRYAIAWMARNANGAPTYIVHLRPTTPLRNPKILDTAITQFLHSGGTALRSVHEMSESAYKCFELVNFRMRTLRGSFSVESANRPRQAMPTTYQANGYVDVLRTDFICAKEQLHGNHVTGFVTPRVAEVDTEEDFEFLEYQAAKHPSIIANLFDT